MNRNGQSTVFFIIFIPIFLVLTAFAVDTGINYYNEKKLENITRDVVEYILLNEIGEEDVYEEAKKIYERNSIDTDFLYVELKYNDEVIIYNSTIYYSFFSSLFKNGKNQAIIHVNGYIENNKVVLESIEDDSDEN